MMEKRKKKKKRGNFKPYNKSISTRSQELLNFVTIFISKFLLQISLYIVEKQIRL